MTIPAEVPATFDPLDTVPVGWLADGEMTREVERLRRIVARAEARTAEVIATAHRRGVPQAQGFGSTTAWLMAATGDPPAVCRSRVRVALALHEMPGTRAAFAAGDLSEPRVRLLVDARGAAPRVFARDEALLVDQGRSLSARLFPLALSHWLRLADPDGALADAGKAFERRRLHISATWEGMVRLDGDLDPESGAVVMTAIGSLAEPRSLDPDDTRTPAQRRADALVEVCRRHLDTGKAPTQGGVKPHLTLSLSPADLIGNGLVDLGTGPITAAAALRLACDAHLTPVVLDDRGNPVAAGRRSRVVSPALRRALDLRDRGCTHPGCNVPARWCDAHHLRHWARGGATTLDNLRLLCRRHHRLAHEGRPWPRREWVPLGRRRRGPAFGGRVHHRRHPRRPGHGPLGRQHPVQVLLLE